MIGVFDIFTPHKSHGASFKGFIELFSPWARGSKEIFSPLFCGLQIHIKPSYVLCVVCEFWRRELERVFENFLRVSFYLESLESSKGLSEDLLLCTSLELLCVEDSSRFGHPFVKENCTSSSFQKDNKNDLTCWS